MFWIRKLLYLARPLLGFRKLNDGIAEEIRLHLQMATEANMAKGMTPAEARTAAELEFGRPELVAERYRDARGVSWASGLRQDVSQAVRSLAHARLFTTVTVLTLGLGIGSAAAIFSLVDWALFRPMAFPEGLVLVGATNKQGQFNGGRYEVHVQAYREKSQVFTEYGLARPFPLNVAIDGEPAGNGLVRVSANLLPMIGVTPVLGRGFQAEENVPGRNDVVIISHAFWVGHFHGAPDVLGKKIEVDQRVCTVVGVLASRQPLPPNLNTDIFQPLPLPPVFNSVGYWFIMFAKLRPGVTPEQADAALAEINVVLPENVATYSPFTKPHVQTMAEVLAVPRSETYWVLVGAVAFLYGIACLNATNLMLARILGRKRELSIRLALGGGHWRLVRLLALESTLLSVAASAAGILLANWLAPLLLLLLQPGNDFRWAQWSLDARAIAILVTLTAFTGFAIVVVPAVRLLRTDVLDGLKDGGNAVGEGLTVGRLRRLIVVCQAIFAVILLTGAGLMVRTLAKLQQVSLGFDETHLVKVQLAFPPGHRSGGAQQLVYLESLRQRLNDIPGVTSVSFGTDNLVRGSYDAGIYSVAAPDTTPLRIELDLISPDFLSTTGIPLKRGRMIHPTGAEVLINETLARTMFGPRDPIGQPLRQVEGGEGRYNWNIVGVVGDVRDTMRGRPGNHVYAPAAWHIYGGVTFLARVGDGMNGEISARIKRAVYTFDPRVIISYVAPMTEVRGWHSDFERFIATGLKVLSAIALALTVIGMFSVLAYTVDQRMGEFGVRLALGATPRDLAGLVLRLGLLMVGSGVAGGLAGAVALGRYLRSVLYETTAYDPVVLGGVAAALIVAAVVASALPAYRATKADVARLLRTD